MIKTVPILQPISVRCTYCVVCQINRTANADVSRLPDPIEPIIGRALNHG